MRDCERERGVSLYQGKRERMSHDPAYSEVVGSSHWLGDSLLFNLKPLNTALIFFLQKSDAVSSYLGNSRCITLN